MEINETRKDFPILKRTMSDKPLVYLDNSATTLKPQPVIDAVMHYYTYLGANSHRGDYEMSAQVDEAFENGRKVAQSFLNAAHTEEIIFTSGSTAGLNMVALMLAHQKLQPGDVILSDESEHASSVLPWLQVAQEKQLKVEYIPLDDEGKITWENFQKAMHENVKVVSIAQVSNVLGFQAPVDQICAYCRDHGIYTLIDGAQSAPHLDIDVQAMQCDFFVLSAHKLCGPTGIGVLYGRKELLDDLDPVFFGGESNARFDKEGNLISKNLPYKFESGTQPIEGVIGMAAAMTYLQYIGKSKIHEHEVTLKRYFLEKIQDLPSIHVYNANSESGICTFNVFDHNTLIPAQDVASYLSTQGIAVRSGQHCAKLLVDVLKTAGTCRASFYFYNTKEDVDVLIEALKQANLQNCVDIFF